MSDIQAGWYTDPEGGERRRYWDGQTWTEHLEPVADPAPAPSGAATADPAAAFGTQVAPGSPVAPAPMAPAPVSAGSSPNQKTLMVVGAAVVGLIVLVLVAKSLTGGGGGGDKAAFCRNYQEMSTITGVSDMARGRATMLKLADTAPSGSIKADAKVVADGYDKVISGNTLAVDEDEVEAAIERIDTYASNTCT